MATENLTTKEAAVRLGVTVRRVQALIKADRLKAVMHGRDWVIEGSSVDNFENLKPGPKPKGETK